jgi:alkyldihydroxyacetonephosphate synthase
MVTLIEELETALGASAISTDVDRLLAASHGTWPVEVKLERLGRLREQTPQCVVSVSSADEVPIVLQIAAKHHLPVVPLGGASGIVGGFRTTPNAVSLSLGHLQDMALDPVSMTVWAGAGVTIQQLEDWLQARGFTCGHFPQSMRLATVGGMVATNGIGTFSTKYGRMRDMVQGLDVVLADGRRIRTQLGPDASTGPDLKHLFLGSEGTLGVVTAAQLQVWPSPECRLMTAFAVPSMDRGLEAVRRIVAQGLRPALVRLYDEAEAAGIWRIVGVQRGAGLLILGQEGRTNVAHLEMRICREILEELGVTHVGDAPAEHWFAHRFDWVRIPETNLRVGGIADAIEISGPWSRLLNIWQATKEAIVPLCTQVESHVSHVYHVGGSVYIIFFAQAEDDTGAIELYDRILGRLLRASLQAGGNVSHHHGIGTAKLRWFQEQLGPGFTVLEDLKHALDPRSLLSPGVLGLGNTTPYSHAQLDFPKEQQSDPLSLH